MKILIYCSLRLTVYDNFIGLTPAVMGSSVPSAAVWTSNEVMVTTDSSQFLPDLRHGPLEAAGDLGGLLVTLLGLGAGVGILELGGVLGHESLLEVLSRLQVLLMMVSEAPTV